MSEILFTETEEQGRNYIDNMEYGRMPTDIKTTIFQSTHKVAVVGSRLVVGIPRGHQNKRYYHWRTVSSFGFRRNSAGTVIPFDCHRPWDYKLSTAWMHRQPRSPFQLFLDNTEASDIFKHACFQNFNFKGPEELYPMMKEYGLLHYWTIPSSLTMGFRQNDWTSFATAAFGKTRVNNRLLAAVQQTDPYLIAYAQQFRGLVPDEAIVSFMENNHFDDEMEEGFQPHSPNLRPALRFTDAVTLGNLINTRLDLSDLNHIHHFVRLGPKYMGERRARTNKVYANWAEFARVY